MENHFTHHFPEKEERRSRIVTCDCLVFLHDVTSHQMLNRAPRQFKMAAFGHVTAQQQYVSSFQFASDNPHPVSFEGVIPPTNPAPQQSNNHKAFTTGQKRKATPVNQQPNYIPYKQPAQQFFCEICNVQLNSLSQASQHKQGKVHKLNTMMFDSLNSVSLLVLLQFY